MPSNSDAYTADASGPVAPQQQIAAPAATDPPVSIAQYLKASLFHPIAAMKMRPPALVPTYPPLTPEQAAQPYRAMSRSYDDASRGFNTMQAFFNGQPVSDEDLANAFVGGSGIMQPLRGIGDIVNYFRGTNYPHRPTPTASPAPPAEWPLPPNAT